MRQAAQTTAMRAWPFRGSSSSDRMFIGEGDLDLIHQPIDFLGATSPRYTALHRAMERGTVRGDYDTLVRTVKDSERWYASLASSKTIPE